MILNVLMVMGVERAEFRASIPVVAALPVVIFVPELGVVLELPAVARRS